MLIDHHVDNTIEQELSPHQNIRRLSDGSIDYSFYDQRARTTRGVAFRSAGRLVTTLFRRLLDLLTGHRAARQPKAIRLQFQPKVRRAGKRIGIATTYRKRNSEAA
jgi:hypothetical protein